MKSKLAKARDKWFESEDGKECCEGQTSGQYLKNRLDRAFLAGAKFSSEQIKELESRIKVVQRNRDSIYNQNARNYKRIKKLEEAVGLLNSMILAGEKHSEISEKIVEQALKMSVHSCKFVAEIGKGGE